MHNVHIWKYARPWLYFAGLALTILGPLLAPGYILTLDLVWGPRSPHIPGLPAWVTEKLILVSIFTLAGTGCYRLCRRLAPGWPAYAAATFFVINPFTYERLMGGQWLVLCGYALLPWVGVSLLELLDRPNLKRSVVLVGWSTALALLSIHTVAMAVLVSGALLAAVGWENPQKVRQAAGWLIGSWGATLAVTGTSLVPTLLGRSSIAREIAGFNAAQFQAFRTNGADLGLPLNAVLLQGFWRERSAQFVLPSSAGWFWVSAIVLALGATTGLIVAIRRGQAVLLALAICGVIATMLALGVAWGPTAPVTNFLAAHVAWFKGYREPGKWLAVAALTDAALLAAGLGLIRDKLHKDWHMYAAVAAVAAPLITVPMMLWGTAGQLKSVSYPASWAALNARLNTLPAAPLGHPDVVILPWHQYLHLPFVGRTVAQPATSYFDRPNVVSGDPELPGVLPTGGLAQTIQTQVIDRRFFSHNAGTSLDSLGVHYIVLIKASDWSTYTWLSNQNDLTLLMETNDWQLYRTGGAK